MQFEAMVWDHRYSDNLIHCLVMECSGVEMKAGAIQAIAPRRDVAYFVDNETAEVMSTVFAQMKQAKESEEDLQHKLQALCPKYRYIAYAWDHASGSHLIKWGILRYSEDQPGVRTDVAYFLDADTAQNDALTMEKLLNQAAAA